MHDVEFRSSATEPSHAVAGTFHPRHKLKTLNLNGEGPTCDLALGGSFLQDGLWEVAIHSQL